MKNSELEKGVSIKGSLPVAIFKEGRTYVAYTPLLDLAAQGTSLANVQKNFDSLFKIYLEETIANGTLEKDLRAHGWRKHRHEWKPPDIAELPKNHSEDMKLKAFVLTPFPHSMNVT